MRIYKKRSIDGLKMKMRRCRLGVEELAQMSGVSIRTIVTARGGNKIQDVLAGYIEEVIEKRLPND